MLTALTLVSLLPIIICGIVMTVSIRSRIEKEYRLEATGQLEAAAAALSDFIAETEVFTTELGENELVQSSLYGKDEEQRTNLYQELYLNTGKLRTYADFSLYSMGGECKYSTDDSLTGSKLPLDFGALRSAGEASGKLALRAETDYSGGEAKTALLAARTITDDRGYYYGFVIVKTAGANLGLVAEQALDRHDKIYIFDRFFNVLYSSDGIAGGETAQALREKVLYSDTVFDIGTDFRYYAMQAGENGLWVVLEQQEMFTEGIRGSMYKVSFIIALICLGLCIIVSYILSSYMTKPVDTLTAAMQKVENGDLDVTVDSGRRDEFGSLAASFNRMTAELKHNVEQQVLAQKKIDDANIATMQAQLNPHFLYNTLDTIKWVAKANNVPEIATLSSGLAKILRTSISGGRFISLKEELDFVSSYAKIQQIRFSGKFEFDILVDSQYYNCRVPKLILQPLVENSIVHGLADRESGRITVSADCVNRVLYLTVTDDGCGLSEDMLEAINSHDRVILEGHIGIENIDQIIRLHYGNEYGLTAHNRGEGGACMELKLPYTCE